MDIKLGIDLGGSKIEVIALDESGATLYRHRVATPQGEYEQIIGSIAELIVSAESVVGECDSVGIGTPGAISPATRLMKNSNSTCLNGRPFLEDITKALGKRVVIENDANCFALSEAVDGAAQGVEIVFGVIIGTGTGAGIVIHQQVIRGANAVAGEWGHNPLPWPQAHELPGANCYCGQQGCIETWLSGTGFARHFAINNSPHKARSAETIVGLAEQGDLQSEQALCDYEDRLARALAHVINILDPQVIVLGGGMSNIQRLYRNVPKRWGQYVFSDRVSTQLLAPKFGDSSGVRGAAWLCS